MAQSGQFLSRVVVTQMLILKPFPKLHVSMACTFLNMDYFSHTQKNLFENMRRSGVYAHIPMSFPTDHSRSKSPWWGHLPRAHWRACRTRKQRGDMVPEALRKLPRGLCTVQGAGGTRNKFRSEPTSQSREGAQG